MQLTRRPIDLFAGLLEAGAFVTAVFTIATSFDFVHQYLELFAHFRVQYLLVSLVLAGFLAALRQRRVLGCVRLAEIPR